MATLNYASQYQEVLVQKFSQSLAFGALYDTPNNSVVKWTGPKTIMIPRIKVGGYTDVNRDVVGNYTRRVDNSFEPKTLGHDREFRTLVDPVDVDETNMALSIANITRVFNEEEATPEHDKYMASKLYAEFTGAGKTADVTVLDPESFLTVFDNFMEQMDEAEVPQTGRILYITPTVKKTVKAAKELQRQLDISGTNEKALNRGVYSLDDVTIVTVPSSRMKTAYNFTNGAVPDAAAKQINMILIHPLSMVAPQKYEFVDLDTPSAATGGKYLYYERKYWDVFILGAKVDGVKINIIA
ncbi:capsid protein [Bacillus pseudomycoides]|uniref:capsid protein n=1 Tax=Bacillus pseudomycoides TaxID=64104 RepID=UPI000BEE1354|nr:capsid protein [Bacillus pseudomycoides]PED73087.1 capsid protein [Bacillus pseudomycoides]PEP61179.1 capsid protein [Bacillus pseudomycoides]PFW68036.1 capsid protein [Bacillus pseudomycoides]PFW80034.1 capsid protein [Bacillus pseudomycoides]PFZ48233.1 capsid protein [Bacillus pseudomycoides]